MAWLSLNQFFRELSHHGIRRRSALLIKNVTIEVAKCNKQAIVVGLHPGTVDSRLSKAFQSNMPDSKRFTPNFSAQNLLQVLHNLKAPHSRKCFAWNSQKVKP